MKYQIRLSKRAERDLDGMDRPTRKRMDRRLDQLAEDPFDPRLTGALTNQGGLRKSRVGGWRIIFMVEAQDVFVVTIERRGQVYHRI
jgi:mRNA interferase RelE/StbE